MLFPRSRGGHKVWENGGWKCCATVLAVEAQSPTAGHQQSWMTPSGRSPHLGALATGPCATVNFVELKSPFLLCYLPRAACVGCPWFACAEVPIPRAVSLKHGCWDGIRARGQQFLALVLVENRKRAGWCLLCMPNLGQAAPLFTLLLTLPLIFMFPWGGAMLGGSIWKDVCWGAAMGAYTPSLTGTQHSLQSGELASPLYLWKTARYQLWMDGIPFLKENVCPVCNSQIRQIKRDFLLVFSNQNIPQSLFAYLLNLCCPNRTYGTFAIAKVNWSPQLLSSEKELMKI